MGSTVLLVVEDDFFQRNLADSLKKLKASVLTAGNKFEALEACANHDVDVALLDIRHNGNDTMQVLARLRKSRPETEVILISNAENIALSMAGMQQGATDDIIVPFEINTLTKKVRAALNRIRARSRAKRKTSLFSVFEDAMVAATFAEAGELETARKIFRDGQGGLSRAGHESQHEKQ